MKGEMPDIKPMQGAFLAPGSRMRPCEEHDMSEAAIKDCEPMRTVPLCDLIKLARKTYACNCDTCDTIAQRGIFHFHHCTADNDNVNAIWVKAVACCSFKLRRANERDGKT